MTSIRRHVRVTGTLARDPGIPRWLRGLILFGALPIPGPVDNVALIVALVILVTRYRDRIALAYRLDALDALVPLDTWGAWS